MSLFPSACVCLRVFVRTGRSREHAGCVTARGSDYISIPPSSDQPWRRWPVCERANFLSETDTLYVWVCTSTQPTDLINTSHNYRGQNLKKLWPFWHLIGEILLITAGLKSMFFHHSMQGTFTFTPQRIEVHTRVSPRRLSHTVMVLSSTS